MARMREVGQPASGPGPVSAREWEPLPGSCARNMARRLGACDRLTRAASGRKVRIKDLVRQLMPMTR